MSPEQPRVTQLDPDVADNIPWSEDITPYDEEHLVTYLRLLDAEAEGAAWPEVARIVLHRDHQRDVNGRIVVGRFIWPVRAGWHARATASCWSRPRFRMGRLTSRCCIDLL